MIPWIEVRSGHFHSPKEDVAGMAGTLLAPVGVTVVLGAQWGDEGKGKLVDLLAQEADVCARCQVCL